MSENRFTLVEAGIFEAWIQLHPQVLRTRPNAKAFGDWLENRNLRITMKTLDEAFVALKAEGRVDIAMTPAEIEQQKIERARVAIWAEVAAKIAPAKIDTKNPRVLNKIFTYLHSHEKGLMSVDRVIKAIDAHKFDEGFWQVPPADLYASPEYVHGRRNYSKDPQSEIQESYGPSGRINHATTSPLKESAVEGAKNLQKIRSDEQDTQRQVAEEAINGFIAVRGGRVSQSQTDTIRQLLRKVAAKRGPLVAMEILTNMPDDARTENYIRARL